MSYPHPEQTPMGWEPPTGTPSPGGGAGQPPFDPPPPGLGQPPASYPAPPPVAPPRKRRRWPWFLLGGFVLLLALIAGCTVLLVRAVSPAIDAANEWLVLVDEQRWDDAYDGLCAGTRQTQSSEEVVPILQGDFGDGIDDYQISQFQNTNGRVSVGGDITIGGREGAITLAMSDASGDWQVCGYTFERLDLGS